MRLDDGLKGDFDRLIARKRISQTEAINGMLYWLLAQPDYLQSVVLGQVAQENWEWLLKRMLDDIQGRLPDDILHKPDFLANPQPNPTRPRG